METSHVSYSAVDIILQFLKSTIGPRFVRAQHRTMEGHRTNDQVSFDEKKLFIEYDAPAS